MTDYLDSFREAQEILRNCACDLDIIADALYVVGNGKLSERLVIVSSMISEANELFSQGISQWNNEQWQSARESTAATLRFALEMPKFIDKVKQDAIQEHKAELSTVDND